MSLPIDCRRSCEMVIVCIFTRGCVSSVLLSSSHVIPRAIRVASVWRAFRFSFLASFFFVPTFCIGCPVHVACRTVTTLAKEVLLILTVNRYDEVVSGFPCSCGYSPGTMWAPLTRNALYKQGWKLSATPTLTIGYSSTEI